MRRSVALAAVLLAGACGGGGGGALPTTGTETTAPAGTDPEGSAPPGTAPSSAPAGPDLAARFRLVKVAELARPTALAVRPGDSALYVAEKGGRVRAVPQGQTSQPGPVDPAPVLDLSGQVTGGTEQGLLGLTFSPDGSRLYVSYTDTRGDSRVVEYGFAAGRADPATRRELLSVDQPFANHNGGQVSFGPDGKLYVGLGDGGGQYDPADRGQDLGTLLAKILRLDPAPSGDQTYTVPPDNPFVNRSGARAETWVWGLRNPWRFSWDRENGDLWIGDVGQDRWEEIDHRPAAATAGSNFGWSLMDGRHRFKGANPRGGVLPIFEYTHDEGCSVVGGYVYRGERVPALRGAYVFGDSCSGQVWGLVQRGGRLVAQRKLTLAGLREATEGGGSFNISSFGEDAAGELYLLSLDGGVFRVE